MQRRGGHWITVLGPLQLLFTLCSLARCEVNESPTLYFRKCLEWWKSPPGLNSSVHKTWRCGGLHVWTVARTRWRDSFHTWGHTPPVLPLVIGTYTKHTERSVGEKSGSNDRYSVSLGLSTNYDMEVDESLIGDGVWQMILRGTHRGSQRHLSQLSCLPARGSGRREAIVKEIVKVSVLFIVWLVF